MDKPVGSTYLAGPITITTMPCRAINHEEILQKHLTFNIIESQCKKNVKLFLTRPERTKEQWRYGSAHS